MEAVSRTLEEGETYDKGKQRVISGRVEEFLDGHKALLYYPFQFGIIDLFTDHSKENVTLYLGDEQHLLRS